MNDLIVSAVSTVPIWWLIRGLSRSRRNLSPVVVRKLRPDSADRLEDLRDSPKRRLLQGAADNFARKPWGRRLASYAAAAHPAVAFSDVFALGLAATIAGGMLGVLLFPTGPLPLASAVAAPIALDRIFVRLGGKRTSRIDQLLPDALHLQAGALRAGHSLTDSIRLTAAETKSPLKEELDRTLRQIELGQSQQEALKQLSVRTSSGDVGLWVTAMLVHRVTGGNLAVVVDSLAGRVRDRLHLRAELKALTAQGRLSGVVVAMAPIGFFLLLSVTSGEQMAVLYKTPVGWALLAAGLGMDAAGFVWIRWILRIHS